MKIVIGTIPHTSQRYPTVGDYWEDEEGTLHIRVSDMKSWKYGVLVALHEMIEFYLCKDRGIDEALIRDFDINFEKLRAAGAIGSEDEPGNHPNAPYRAEHQFATFIERMMALELKVDWGRYEKTVVEL